jgi:hypothetical protein
LVAGEDVADKARERALVETTRKLYSWFPPGRIVDFEQPDLLLIDGDDRTGIEVTEMFQPPKHGSKYGPHVVAKFHQRVMAIAERRAESLPPVDVLTYFDYRHHLDDADACAKELIAFVQSHPPGTYGQIERIPHGFGVVRIAEPTASMVPRWRCFDSGETVEATHEMIAAVIAEKNRLVPSYRERVPRVWLLIACSFADFANNFYVRRGAATWRFDFDFDKVLLLSSESGVFNLLRNDGTAGDPFTEGPEHRIIVR